jgi:hypothetical protein
MRRADKCKMTDDGMNENINKFSSTNNPQKQPTDIIQIEGIGKVRSYGELNMEGIIKRLLQSRYISN